MRVLLAVDGSPSAAVATGLAAALDWPVGTAIRVVAVVNEATLPIGAAWLSTSPETLQRIEDDVFAATRQAVADAVAAVTRPGLAVSAHVLRGRPASAIVEDAADFGADLVIVGSRGHGSIETALLGSVSAEVVDHAPCPVLVARRGWLHRLVLADDGSEGAHRARSIVRDWPILRSLPACVISVARLPGTWEPPETPSVGTLPTDPYFDALAQRRRRQAEIAREAHDELADAGHPCEFQVRMGGPATEIVAGAIEWGADCIVIGTHGETGLRRALLGSVARSVLLHARCSVLVVRQQQSGILHEGVLPARELIPS
jgi:nucleotide-binding universal stress UspA family protein